MAFGDYVVGKLRNLLGLQAVLPAQNQFPFPKDPLMEGVIGWYNRQTHIARDRRTTYYDMEQIGDFVLGASALDMYTEDAFPFSQERSSTVWITSGNPKVKDLIDRLNQKIEVETLIPCIARTAAQYGDDFEYLFLSDNGVEAVRQVLPHQLTRIENMWGQLLGFHPGISEYLPGRDDPPTPLSRPWDIVHTRIPSPHMRNTGHGLSMLYPVRYLWRQLKIMLDAAVLYRWTRGPDRLVYYIDTGTHTAEDQMKLVNMWRLYIKKRQQFAPQGYGGSGATNSAFEQQWNPECYTADTKVPLLDGRTLTMMELCEEYPKGTYFWVYAVDPETHEMVPGLASHPHLIRKDAPIVKITLDDGSVLRCTYKNGIMLRSGEMVYAQDLKPGDRLMPFNRRESSKAEGDITDGYELVYNPGVGQERFTHQIVCPGESGYVVHHRDFNKRNNSPDNLELMEAGEHMRYHRKCGQCALTEYNKSDAHRRKASETNRRLRKQKAQHLRDYNTSQKRLDDWRAFWVDEERSADSRAKKSQYMQKTWQNPENREKMVESIRQSNIRRRGQVTPNMLLCHAWYARCESCGIFMIRDKEVYPNKEAGIACPGCGVVHNWIYVQGNKAKELNALLSSIEDNHVPLETVDSTLYRNHTVVSVEEDGVADVYDFTVRDYHNFAVETNVSGCGIMVSNSIDEDIFWPLPRDSQSRVERLAGGANVGEIADIQLYINLFFAGLRIPKAFMGFEGEIMAREVLPYQSIRYANVAYKLQRAVLTSLLRMYQIHNTIKGYDPLEPENAFKVHTSTISHLYDQAKLELLKVKMEMMETLMNFGDQVKLEKDAWLRYVLRTYMDMEDAVIEALAPKKDGDEEETVTPGMESAIHKAVSSNPSIQAGLKNLRDMSTFFNPSVDSGATPMTDSVDTLMEAVKEGENDEFYTKVRAVVERNSKK